MAAHRYYRFKIATTTYAPYYLGLYEIELHAVYGGPDITTPATSITMSVAANVVSLLDGNTSAGFDYAWCYGAFPVYITIDLGAGNASEVPEAKIWAQAAAAPVDFEFQYSDDGATWLKQFEHLGVSGWVQGTPKTFDLKIPLANPLTISSIVDSSGPENTASTPALINGTGFRGGDDGTGVIILPISGISFGGSAATFTVLTDSVVAVNVPSHAAGIVDIVVTRSDGTATLVGGYQFIASTVGWLSSPYVLLPKVGEIEAADYRWNSSLEGFDINRIEVPTPIPQINVTPSPLAQASGTIIREEFLFDFYFKIWIVPNRLEMRNPRIGVDIPFHVWNAFPYRHTLTDIIGTGADGLELDTDAPDTFYEVEYREVNIQILPTAPLTVDAVLEFIFEWGSGLFNFIAERASVVNITPDVPVKEIWSWLTDIIVTDNGKEQRIALRTVPRRSQTTKLIALNKEEVRVKFDQMLLDFVGEVVMPYFQYATPTTQSAFSGATGLAFDPSKTDVRPGEYALVITKTADQLVRFATISDTGCTLDAPLTIDAPTGSIIVPSLPSLVDAGAALRRYAVQDVAEMELTSRVTQHREVFSRPGSQTVLPTLDGLYVLDRRPLANSGTVDDKFDSGAKIVDFQTGPLETSTHWAHSQLEGGRQYLIKRAHEPAEMDFWRDFLDAVKGRQIAFLTPTYREDGYASERPVDMAGTMRLAGSRYSTVFFKQGPYTHLRIWTDAGYHDVTVSDATALADGNDEIVFEPALPTGELWRNVKYISFLGKVRLASDDVELEHYALDTFLNLTLRTVDA